MSVYYTVFEHLTVNTNKGSEALGAIAIMRDQLALLQSQALLNEAKIYSLAADIDGKHYDGSDLKALLDAMEEATWADIIVEYTGYDMVYPFDMEERLDKIGDETLSEIRYVMCNSAYGEQNAGRLCFYGEKDGKLHRGPVKFEQRETIPAGIDWHIVESPAIAVYGTLDTDADLETAKSICTALLPYGISEYSHFKTEDREFDFEIDLMASLSTGAVSEVVRLTGELSRIPQANVSWLLSFRSTGHPEPKLLQVDFDADGKAILEIAEV